MQLEYIMLFITIMLIINELNNVISVAVISYIDF